jgi:FkbM family methyltransferase
VIRNLRLRLSSKKIDERILNPFIPRQIELHENVKLPDLEVPLTQHYGQRGEDLIVKSILDSILFQRKLNYKNVWYIEIGANHPISTSATFLLYENGARGVLVEANPKLIQSLSDVRPEDTIINAAIVGTGEGKVKLFVSSADELSTTVKSNLDFWPDYPVVEEVEVDKTEVTELLLKYYPEQSISFISIDCEGPDFEILERIDLDRFPFDVIQIEPSNHINYKATEGISRYLFHKGYSLISKTEVNCIFLKIKDLPHFRQELEIPFSWEACSFDIFDTLLTRRFKDPRSVIYNFCAKNGIDFERRLSADNGARSLEEIYIEAGIPLELMAKEIEEELENLVPIRENIGKVKQGDTFVSDMYLNENQIRTLLGKINLSDHPIYVSNSDKASGSYWKNLQKETYPLIHFGDNIISDYRNALEVGIRAVLCTQSEFTQYEQLIKEQNEQLAYLLRELRLSHIDSQSDIVDKTSCTYNLTLLFAFCEILYKKNRNLVFLGRDSFQLYRIYSRYFGDCEYLQFSRDLLDDLETCRQKLRSFASISPLFVDIVSTGATWTKLNDEFDVFVLIKIVDWSYSYSDPNLRNLDYVFTNEEVKHSTVLELLNPARNGRLKSLDPTTLESQEFAEHELNPALIEKLLFASDKAVKLRPHYDGIKGKIKDPILLAKSSLTSIWEKEVMLSSYFKESILAETSNLNDLQKNLSRKLSS